ncbi:uracil-DNA glycosylase [Gordonia rubripertincta]|uniref:Type-5 uracil-DNA glycosylase n=1 Tax=Gordonia rubripertincta TaxID=36822 RepID=A0AAW4GA82_GORRU|nr:uracil-DNA glycosylase [Gordonia rubripertincta]MBM7280104.1 uracil-DNA glycosylase [Gordonia rubripertincta]
MAPRQRFRNLAELDAQLIDCRACPRLVEWREQVAREKRRAFADQEYWGRPVPGIGPADARLLIVGLAPAAHGGNRTGRMFTGDQSGDFLFSAMYLAGLVSQPHSVSMDDGLELFDTRITAPVHCAPPQNKPTVEERDRCSRWLHGELELLAPTARSVITLGAFGWQSTLRTFGALGWTVPRPAPKFGHGSSTILTRDDATLEVFGCYHVSQHNTFTGRLTVEMLVDVLRAAATSAGIGVRE